jgi:hypothetical protein
MLDTNHKHSPSFENTHVISTIVIIIIIIITVVVLYSRSITPVFIVHEYYSSQQTYMIYRLKESVDHRILLRNVLII